MENYCRGLGWEGVQHSQIKTSLDTTAHNDKHEGNSCMMAEGMPDTTGGNSISMQRESRHKHR